MGGRDVGEPRSVAQPAADDALGVYGHGPHRAPEASNIRLAPMYPGFSMTTSSPRSSSRRAHRSSACCEPLTTITWPGEQRTPRDRATYLQSHRRAARSRVHDGHSSMRRDSDCAGCAHSSGARAPREQLQIWARMGERDVAGHSAGVLEFPRIRLPKLDRRAPGPCAVRRPATAGACNSRSGNCRHTKVPEPRSSRNSPR